MWNHLSRIYHFHTFSNHVGRIIQKTYLVSKTFRNTSVFFKSIEGLKTTLTFQSESTSLLLKNLENHDHFLIVYRVIPFVTCFRQHCLCFITFPSPENCVAFKFTQFKIRRSVSVWKKKPIVFIPKPTQRRVKLKRELRAPGYPMLSLSWSLADGQRGQKHSSGAIRSVPMIRLAIM